MKTKTKFLAILLFSILLMLVFTPGVSAGPPKKQYGILRGVEQTGDGPDSEGRYEYIVTMEINGVAIYLHMWMTEGEATELSGAIGKWITIEYYWDGHGHRIYNGFKYGDHRDDYYVYVYDYISYDFSISSESAYSTHSSSNDNTVYNIYNNIE